MPREQKLPRGERAVLLEPPAADEKRERARAAVEAGGLEIEEHERRTRRGSTREQRRLAGRAIQPLRQRADPLAPVPRVRLPAPIDDEAAAAPLAAEDRDDVGARRGHKDPPPTRRL